LITSAEWLNGPNLLAKWQKLLEEPGPVRFRQFQHGIGLFIHERVGLGKPVFHRYRACRAAYHLLNFRRIHQSLRAIASTAFVLVSAMD